MKLLVINQFGANQIVDAQAIPPIGAQVDLFFKPAPRVKEVVMWPGEEMLRSLQAVDMQIEALVIVS